MPVQSSYVTIGYHFGCKENTTNTTNTAKYREFYKGSLIFQLQNKHCQVI